ncbi:phage tail tape measure protein [Brooklawnia cerclae]|uniref:TP901 family phage tail tape measure protein n=1 Tax=Brooklawnia cerclae TaxID=349934 RepID=A0ABX0SJ41_9ACTN|nr:phage tail tape measure protein [Brooklawnia cerclae]NIH57323.1 TP901 family phage tail tape measure protein [Brooklawnia cerclae]
MAGATSVGGRTVTVRLAANVDGFTAGMAKAKKSADEFAKATSTASQTQEWKTASTTMIATGAAMVGAFAAATAKASEFDSSMSKVAATGDDARGNLDGLRAAAMEWGAATKYSADEAAGGIESLLKAGVSATDVIGGGLEGALNLAATGNLSVADSAEVAATAMTQFGLAGSDVPHIADLIAAGAGKAQGEVSDMSAALNQSGLVASQFGLSIEETTGSLAAFASAGLVGSDAGTSFKSMLLQLAAPSGKAATLMSDLGIAAYDANGNFVGMSALAGQLQDKLGGLDQASRDSALGIIFGTDAIRAANVLYQQGADGIDEWTSKVDDAGYAAESAAIQQDNLSGDIEKLSGSFDTLLISAGEASSNGLRPIVQDLTGFVDLLGRHGDAVGTILGITGALGGFLIAAGSVMKAVTAVSEFRSAMETLPKYVQTGVGSLGRLSVAAGLTAAGIGVMSAIGSRIQDSMDSSRMSVDQMTTALEIYARTTDQAAIDHGFEQALAGSSYAVKDMSTAMRMLREDGGGAMEGFETWVMGIAGMKGNFAMVREELDKLDQGLAQLDPDTAARAFITLRSSFEGYSDADIVEALPEYADSLRQVALEAGVASVSNEELVRWMGGVKPESVIAAEALSELGYAHVDAGASAEEQADALEQLMQTQEEMADAAIAASNSQIGYAKALEDAASAAEAEGITIDQSTGKINVFANEASRDAQSALNDLADAAFANRDAMQQNGASVEDLTAYTQKARDEFINAATQMGLTGDQAAALADSYGLIPGQVTTNVSTPGAEASQSQVDTLHRKLDELPPNTAAYIQSIWDSQGYGAALDALYNITSTPWVVTVQTAFSETNRAAYNIGAPGRAGGGAVWGPGTATSDSIHALLSNGEYVMRTWAAERIGYDRLAHMNATGDMPAFADGGRASLAKAAPYMAPITGQSAQPGTPTTVSKVFQINQVDDPAATAAAIDRRDTAYRV